MSNKKVILYQFPFLQLTNKGKFEHPTLDLHLVEMVKDDTIDSFQENDIDFPLENFSIPVMKGKKYCDYIFSICRN